MMRASDAATTAANGDPRLVTFALGEVVVYAAALVCHESQCTPAFNRWPCPGCGMRRLVEDAQVLAVGDLPGDRNVREIMVCADCAAHVQGTSPVRIAPRDREEVRVDVLE